MTWRKKFGDESWLKGISHEIIKIASQTMARLILPSAGWPAVYFLLSLVCMPVNALHFYMQGGQPKCFFEELPKDTLTVGKTCPTPSASCA